MLWSGSYRSKMNSTRIKFCVKDQRAKMLQNKISLSSETECVVYCNFLHFYIWTVFVQGNCSHPRQYFSVFYSTESRTRPTNKKPLFWRRSTTAAHSRMRLIRLWPGCRRPNRNCPTWTLGRKCPTSWKRWKNKRYWSSVWISRKLDNSEI